MTEYSMIWLGVGSAMLVVGIGIGMLAAYFLLPGPKRAKELQRDLDTVNAEFAQYRSRVTEHFSKTSNLFQDLTTRYRGFYDHLASGAQELCREGSDTLRLDFSDVGLLPNRESRINTATPESDRQDSEKTNSDPEWEGSDVGAQTPGSSASLDRKGDNSV